jgi:hypothetical protein
LGATTFGGGELERKKIIQKKKKKKLKGAKIPKKYLQKVYELRGYSSIQTKVSEQGFVLLILF